MKKYLSGFMAICLAIGFLAFTPIEKKPAAPLTNLYWFNVPSSIAKNSILTNSDVAYLNAHQASDPSPASCTGNTNYCHVGFSDAKVTVIGSSVTLNGSQMPDSFDSKP